MIKRKNRLLTLSLAAALSLTVIGCGSTDSSSTTDDTSPTVENNTTTTDSNSTIDSNTTTESLGYSDIDLRDANTTLTSDFYAPAVMSSVIEESEAVTWSTFSGSLANLDRFTLADVSSDIVLVSDTNTTVNKSLSVSTTLHGQSSTDKNTLLKTTFQFVEIATGKYAIYSSKHSNYALDIDDDNTSVILRDVRSLTAFNAKTATKFLTFDALSSGGKLTVNGRYTLNQANSIANKTISYDLDTSLAGKKITISSSGLTLDSSGSAVTLYKAPVGLDISSDFNPDSVARVSNAEFYDTSATEGNLLADLPTQVASKYTSQLASAGLDTATTTAASAMIDTIATHLAAQGSQMRYPKEFYLAIREGFLKRTLVTSEAMDATMGELTVPYVYFTDEVDSDGNYHPFMVVATHGLPDTIAGLGDVPHPPGDGLSGQYPDQKVTRSFYEENFILKIPMRDYGEVSSVTENDLTDIKSLASDEGVGTYDHHNYASTGSSAVAIDGVVIYPSYNNTLNFAQEFGELSAIGMHSGRGLGVHYHADAFSVANESINDSSEEGFALYNKSDYAGHSHPPIVGIGFDGVACYGVYLDGDSESDGVNTPLDEFGGHEHGNYGYHYHAHSSSNTSAVNTAPGPNGATTGGNSYTLHEFAPLGAWAGRINLVPEFGSKDKRSVYSGNL